ncbi:hypothetical protein CRENPOLYSF1_140050 [Crenothrix polyspora]|uniref:Uncharacterized protein n=1 Tax=Crenothrix polyspora TaxID=360316 RepID=A0A1R4H261_9GAMM|nr:hypothetical protein CRENPOLYSF1_140050 [Crenothrix polyspora]
MPEGFVFEVVKSAILEGGSECLNDLHNFLSNQSCLQGVGERLQKIKTSHIPKLRFYGDRATLKKKCCCRLAKHLCKIAS